MHNFIIKLLSYFIFSPNRRRIFRNKYMKINPVWLAEEDLKIFINERISDVLNTFCDIKQVPKATGNIKKIQTAGSILLYEFDKICRSNNINYWLDFGTLLGAYRHQGFIPWDDDIDVGMMRRDFDKLKKVVLSSGDFEILDCMHFKNINNPCHVNKFCFKSNNIDMHLAVDIFIFDYINSDNPEKVYDEYIKEKQKLKKELNNLYLSYNWNICEDKKDSDKINKVFNKYSSKYKEHQDGNIIIYGIENPENKAKRIFKKEIIFPIKEIEFEGRKYYAPNNTEKYLTINFGDYMKFPPDVGFAKHLRYSEEQIEKLNEIINEK